MRRAGRCATCNAAVLEFARAAWRVLARPGLRVLDVGARDVNGSLRDDVLATAPREYVAVDIVPGVGVGVICDASRLVDRFGTAAFDAVLCTEMLEHAKDWRGAVNAMKRVLRLDGVLVLTTRAPGFRRHAYPHDYWRFTVADMRAAFADMRGLVVLPDPSAPGVMVAGRRGRGTNFVDLSAIAPLAVPRRR